MARKNSDEIVATSTRASRRAAAEAMAAAAEEESGKKARTPRTARGEVEVEKSASKVSPTYGRALAALDEQLDVIEKDYGLTSSSVDNTSARVSSGMLSLDIILARGLVPGWYTIYGPEQSCKSTGATTLIAAALNTDVPIIQWWDFEGSSSGDYIASILRVNGIKTDVNEIFGIRNPKTQQWEVQPRVRYYTEGVAEKFFDSIAKLERILPDKVMMNDQWYLIYEDTKANRKVTGDDYDKNYWRKTGKLRIPVDNSSLQALVVLDSYPAMLPEKQDVDDPNSAIGVQARMFSDQIKRIKGKLRAKRIAIVGINQLRLKPMVMYGSPEYEPGGEALKFFSDARLKFTPRALSAIPGVKGKGYIEEEDSISGSGVDTYRYIHVRAIKNKLSTPNIEGWLRLWITDEDGQGCGFDPVYDTYWYLQQTGQVTGKRNSMKICLEGRPVSKTISWMDFKIMVLGTTKEIRATCEKASMKPLRIRDFCMKQLSSGEGLDMYYHRKKEGHDSKSDEDENS